MCNKNGNTFIATFYYVLLAPDLYDGLFSIVTLMNSVLTCLFHLKMCTLYFGAKEKNSVTLPHSAQRKHEFWGKIQNMSTNKKIPPRKKIGLELIHQRLVHRSTR